MSVRRLDPNQPEDFRFSPENLRWVEGIMQNYPPGKQASAVIPVLWRAQEQNHGWLSEPAMRHVAELLGMSYIRVYEVATFYTMFLLSPVGRKAHVQVCGTTPCMLRGSEALIEFCRQRISKEPHHLSVDGDLSWEEVECLGACVNAPMVLIGKDTYEDLTPETFAGIIEALVRGETPKAGPQIDRQLSAPIGKLTTLTDPALYRDGEEPPREPRTEDAAPVPPADAARPMTGNVITSPALKPPRQKRHEGEAKATAAPAEPAGKPPLDSPDRPASLTAARADKPDDLKLITGIGPKIELTLHSLGIFHFDQVAAWNEKERHWVDRYLNFKGRIERDGWVKQATALAKGGIDEYVRVFGKEPK